MKGKKSTVKITLLFLVLGLTQHLFAASITANTGTNLRWDDAATWVGGVVPGAGDEVTIPAGSQVVIRDPYTTASPLQVGSINVFGTLTFGSTSGTARRMDVSIAFVIASGGVVTNDGAAAHQLFIGGAFSNNGTFTATNGSGSITVTFNGVGDQAISGASTIEFGSTVVNKASGTLSFNSGVSIFNVSNFTLSQGTFSAPENVVASGNVILTAGTYNAGVSTVLNGNFTNNGATFSAGTGSVTFNGSSQTIGGSSATTFYDVIVYAPSTTTHTVAVTVGRNLIVSDGATLVIPGHNFTVNGSTTIGGGTSGLLQFSSTANSKRFEGLVTVNAGAIWDNSIGKNIVLTGGLTNNGTFTAGSGTYTFEANAQNINGNVAFTNVVVSGVQLVNYGEFYVSGSLSSSGTFTQTANSTLVIGGTISISTLQATATGNTVEYSGSAQSVKGVNYFHLTLSGNGVKTLASGTTSISGNLTLSGSVSATTVTSLTVSSHVVVGTGASFTLAGFNFDCNGEFTVQNNGTATISDFAATKTFRGGLIVNSGGLFDNSINDNLFFHNGIVNDGSFLGGNAANYEFIGSFNQTLSGQLTLPNIVVSSGLTLTNNAILTSKTNIGGGGIFQQGTNAYVEVQGTLSVTNFVASASGNTVKYSATGGQTVRGVNYHHLELAGSGIKDLATGTTSIAGNFLITGASSSTAIGLTIGGNLTIGENGAFQVKGHDLTVTGGTSLSATNTATLSFSSINGTKIFIGHVSIGNGGVWDNSSVHESFTLRGGLTDNGSFLPGTGTYTFDTNNQTLSGSSMSLATVVINGVNLALDNNLDVNTSLTGTGSIAPGANKSLDINGTASLTSIAGASGSYVNYNGATPSVITGTYGTLYLNQSSGIATLAGNVSVTDVLELASGNLSLGVSNLTLGASATIANAFPPASNMIIASGSGELRKTFTGTGSFTFPVGDNTNTLEYSPITIDLTSATGFSSGYLGIRLADDKHFWDNSASDFISRNWMIIQSGITGAVASVSASYLPTDVATSEANIKPAYVNGTFNASSNPWVRGANPVASNLISITNVPLNGTTYVTGISGLVPSVSITGGGVTVCKDATVNLGATVSGEGTITYAWSPSTGLSNAAISNPVATVSATQSYTLTVYDGNGQTAQTSTTLTAQAPSVSLADISICAGTPGDLTAGGASTYSWSPSAGLSATTGATVAANPSTTTVYTVTGTDGSGCTAEATATVTVKDLPSVSVNNATVCQGTGATLTAGGAVSYAWSPNTNLSATSGATVTATPTGTLTYTVTGTGANGCTNTAASTVTVVPLPAKPTITASGLDTETPTLTSSSATGNKWSKGGSEIPGATNQTLTVTSEGSYTVTVTSSGCTSLASNPFVMVVTGIEPSVSQATFKLYPNPVSNVLNLELTGFDTSLPVDVKVVDMLGRVVMLRSIHIENQSLEVGSLANGKHQLIAAQGSRVVRGRFVKQ